MKFKLSMNVKIPTCTYGNVSPEPDIDIDEAEVQAVFNEFAPDISRDIKNDPMFSSLSDGQDIEELSNYRKGLLITRYLIIRQLVDIREDLGRAADEYQKTTGNSLFEIRVSK